MVQVIAIGLGQCQTEGQGVTNKTQWKMAM